MLARLLNLIEAEGRWPDALYFGKVSLADKGEGPLAENQRPLTVLPLLYRFWASFRLYDLFDWISTWVHPACLAKAGSSAADLWVGVALRLEQAAATGTPIAGVSLDWKKCFDLIPRNIAPSPTRIWNAPTNPEASSRLL